MLKLPKLNTNFLRDYKQLVFSIVVMIAIPGLMVVNTYYIIRPMQENMDAELRNKAIMAGEGLNAYISESLDNPNEIQKKVVKYGTLTENIKKISIYRKENDSLIAVASLKEAEIGTEVENTDRTIFFLTYYGENPVTRLMLAQNSETVVGKNIVAGERFWSVIVPIKDEYGRKIYLANLWVSLADADALTSNTLMISGFILVGSILVVILLLASNSKLFEYSILFRRLKEVDEMKDDFISVASHELRTPLTVVKGYLSMLMEDVAKNKISTKEKEEMIRSAAENTDRLGELVSDLLDVSRIEQGRQKLVIEKTDILEIARKVFSGFEIEAKSHGLVLKEDYAKSPLYSDVDKDKLKQILVNLVGNSIKYTKKGEVHLIITEDENTNKIVVHDTGIGMDETERRNLFTKFYRVKNDETKDVTGTGLGLWITKELVESMKGKILVDSIKGVGSQFTVMLPKSK